ncbi:triose-phosphate isomerase [Stomatohabitans albus]|uniref:triose-phosphate isomerase n=1 Tax=Stomatohabitans albus TaxID=3110766 RepID=UPI00300C1706
MARKPFIAGNWKMNLTHLEGIKLVQETAYKLTKAETDKVDVAVIPAFTALRSIQTLIDGDRLPLSLGAQDVAIEDSGAFTGAVSAEMLAALDVRWVLAGHSERREIFGDTDADVNAKVKQILKYGMNPILCVGETLDQREAGETDTVLSHQVTKGLAGISHDDMARVVIAYEPVWAIGTGKTATPEDANTGCATIRATIAQLFNEDVGDAIIIQYGGSVKPGNVAELMAQPDIDGALVGGASLSADDFAALVAAS